MLTKLRLTNLDNLLDLSKDPKFQAADPAAKRAAFEDVGSRDPNYANENDITKEYIRAKFGVSNEVPATREKTSTGSALLHGAERGFLPSLAGLGGAAGGASIGATLGAFGGPAAPVTVPVGAVIGGLLGGIGAGYGTNVAQDYALKKAPGFAKYIGQDEETRRLEAEKHPYASFAGEIAPLALTMSPRLGAPVLRAGAGAFERMVSKPVVGRAFGGTLNAGLEAGRQSQQGQPLDPYKIAMAAGTGAVFVKPNRAGRVITSGAERVVGAIPGMGARGPRPAPAAAPDEELTIPGEAPVEQQPININEVISPPKVARPQEQTALTLPKDLAGAKPRYGYGSKQFDVNFNSDVDKAAYIASQPKPSARDADYVAWASDATGMSPAEVRAHGNVIRSTIKQQAVSRLFSDKDSEISTIDIPTVWKPAQPMVPERGPVVMGLVLKPDGSLGTQPITPETMAAPNDFQAQFDADMASRGLQKPPSMPATMAPEPQISMPPPGGVPPGGTVPPSAVPPSGAGPKAPTPPGKYAASINLERFDTPEDVKNIVRQSADRNDQWWEARRGKMTFEDIKAAALESGVTPETIGRMKPGEILNAENNLRARQINAEIAANAAAAANQAMGGTAVQKLEVLKQLAAFDIINSRVSGAQTELGRSLSANRIRVTGEAQARATKMELEKLYNEGSIDRNKLDDLNEKLKNPELSEAEAQAAIDNFNESGDVTLDDIMVRISTLNDPVSIAKVLSAASKPTIWDKFQEVYYNAILSNPATHAANISSNALSAAFSVPETALAAMMGRGKAGEVVSLGEAPARFFGLMQGLKEGGAIALKTAFGDTPQISEKTGQFKRQNAISGVKGRIIRTPGRMLLAADEFFKAVSHRGEINATAFRTAKGEGLKGDAFAARIKELQANPTDAMLLAAQKAAKYHSFTQELGKTGKAAETMLNTPVMRPFKLILPFFRTPVNVSKYAIERTPLAFLGPQLRANIMGKNGPVAAQQGRARLAMGTTIAGMAMAYAMDGSITGSGPADPGQKNVLRAQGWRPYSIKIGDTYYSYQRIEPLSTLFGAAADIVNLNKDAKIKGPLEEGYAAEKINQLIATATNNVTNKAWMQSLSSAIEAYNDPDGKGQGFINLMAGSTVPGVVAFAARSQDPYARDVKTPTDAILNRIPGMSQTVPYKRDIYGKAIKTDKPSFFGSPIATSPVSPNLVRNEIARLGMAIRPPERTALGVKLTPQQFDQYQLNAHRMLMPMLRNRISAPDWPKMNDELKKVLIKNIFNVARSAAAVQTLAQLKEIERGYVTKKTELPVKMGIMKPIPQPPTQAERLVNMLKSAF